MTYLICTGDEAFHNQALLSVSSRGHVTVVTILLPTTAILLAASCLSTKVASYQITMSCLCVSWQDDKQAS